MRSIQKIIKSVDNTKVIGICLAIVLGGIAIGLLTDSSNVGAIVQKNNRPSSERVSNPYNTMLSPEGELSVVRAPSEVDFSVLHPERLEELPTYDPEADEPWWQVDIRSADITNLDLVNNLEDLLYADFDSKTRWPNELPDGFDPQEIMELGKNPGLGVRELHEIGITGKGVGIAIIDQGLLVEHSEYKDQLKLYEEMHCVDNYATMHGPAVASIAVGKSVGVAPGADLYYIAETSSEYEEEEFKQELVWLAKSIDRIMEINQMLPAGEKIRVISYSGRIEEWMSGYEAVLESIDKAEAEGIYTIYVEGAPFLGAERNPLKSADNINSYTAATSWELLDGKLLVPMYSRCTASPTGKDDYVFYRMGGISWAVPYVAGLYALACQVNPDVTPEVFWELAFETADTTLDGLGMIVNPSKLIEKFKKLGTVR